MTRAEGKVVGAIEAFELGKRAEEAYLVVVTLEDDGSRTYTSHGKEYWKHERPWEPPGVKLWNSNEAVPPELDPFIPAYDKMTTVENA